ncbi:sensor histidine kinase [Bradyrhizobium semiaridum]|uniref:sensor histidine kinase n=1 Tax=Bradyrhizobium semiaridum TaxID=2821404 RepID=UPI001CE2D256|nr:ATP-binding protein [Bradyrhizobium semiaridum]
MLLAKTLRSSTFRLALIAIGAFGLIVAAIFAYVYWSTVAYVRSESDRAIMTEQTNLREAFARSGRDGLVALIGQRIADRGFAGHVYLLAGPDAAVLAGNLKQWPSGAAAQGWTEFRAPMLPANPLVRAVTERLANGDDLLVGRDIGDLDGFMARIRVAGIAVAGLIVVLAAVASIGVTRRTVGRIESINATSRAIMLSGLDRRIPLRGSHDEWDRVAENLNLMLDRIQTLMGDVKQVSDNITHDLRTPLTRMRGRLEKAYHAQRNGEADAALIGDTIADLDTVLRMFASLTRISEIETRARRVAFRSVNLVEIAGEVVELYDAAAERDATRLDLAGDAEVLLTGDRDLLFDAIANLVDNAIKHGRAGGRVSVTCCNSDEGAVIAVADNGPGIPAGQHDRVFKRFYRLEQSRYTPGNGLGLSLVAAVASLHGARIELRDNAPGLLVQLYFPPAASGT